MEHPDVPQAVGELPLLGLDTNDVTYFLGRRDDHRDSSERNGTERLVELGVQVELQEHTAALSPR
jgi:hypothetical protein